MSVHQISRGFRSAIARHPRTLYLRPTHHHLHLPRFGLAQPIHHPLHPSRLGVVQAIRAQSYTTNGSTSGENYLAVRFGRLEKSIESSGKGLKEMLEKRLEMFEERFEERMDKKMDKSLERVGKSMEKSIESAVRINLGWIKLILGAAIAAVLWEVIFYYDHTEGKLWKRQYNMETRLLKRLDNMETRLTTMFQNEITQLIMELKIERQEGLLSGQNKKQ